MSSSVLPAVVRKYVVKKLSTKFAEAVELVTVPCPRLMAGQLLIMNRFIGINASDINYTSARYDTSVRPPFDCGFEGVGEVVQAGEGCTRFAPGQTVGYIQFGAFADYVVIAEKAALPLPKAAAVYLPMLVSGLTAAICLDKVAELKPGDVVLVTAAAGGTGQFAVQLAKHAGCHVIGTCSSQSKIDLLRKLGCDRPINTQTEDLSSVLRQEYPYGVNVVYESVGGGTFDTCAQALARGGRLIVIGFVSGYDSAAGFSPLRTTTPALVAMLLTRSASVRGFFLSHYSKLYEEYLARLISLHAEGRLAVHVDDGSSRSADTTRFIGLQSVPAAVEYLYTRRNVGKICVEMPNVTSKM